ncbi:cornifelin homolog [Rhincodon typus]|uniref:cornifelin homolog n=1 Tax=Rhincodon typus TaxID=259920 RepID=UPI0020307F41|nr:cornifelin homolog [Rhincodon typus]
MNPSRSIRYIRFDGTERKSLPFLKSSVPLISIMASTTVIIQQPGSGIPAANGQWSTGVCNICDDMAVCCGGLFCPCFLGCYVASAYGESCCLGFLPGGMTALRTHMRITYGIQGTICQDAMMTTCCGLFEICRMTREMRRRNR